MGNKPRSALHEIFAFRLREARDGKGISQAGLAEMAGVSPGYVGDIETAKKFPSPLLLERFAAVLGTQAYRLLVPPGEEPSPLARDIAYGIGNDLKTAIDKDLRDLLARYAAGGTPGKE